MRPVDSLPCLHHAQGGSCDGNHKRGACASSVRVVVASWKAVLTGVALIVVAGACAGDDSVMRTATSTGLATVTGPGSPIQIEIGDNWFDGPTVVGGREAGRAVTLEVTAGVVILQIKNTGASFHNVHVLGLEKASELLKIEDEATLDLGAIPAGEYNFVCDYHPSEMIGRLVVK